MLEILGLIFASGVIYRTAQRRGGRGWLWILIAVLGYLAIAALSSLILAPKLVPLYLVVGWVWIGLCLGGAFVFTGGFASAGTTWQCVDCGMYNDPSTIKCACGRRFDDAEQVGTSA